MKHLDAGIHYDYLALKVADGTIGANVMSLCCKALIEVNKVADLSLSNFTINVSDLRYLWSVGKAWKNNYHSVELSIPKANNVVAAFIYRNKIGGHLFSVWRIGKEPIPDKIVDKLMLFAEK